jgi:hypothetical protein
LPVVILRTILRSAGPLACYSRRRGGKPRLKPVPAPRQHAGGPIPIPGGHPGCRGCRRDVGCTDISATHVKRDVDCSRGAALRATTVAAATATDFWSDILASSFQFPQELGASASCTSPLLSAAWISAPMAVLVAIPALLCGCPIRSDHGWCALAAQVFEPCPSLCSEGFLQL